MVRGPDRHSLAVTGQFTATLKRGWWETQDDIYVVERLSKPLLGRPAIEKLGISLCIAAIDKTTLAKQFSHMFSGLGKLQRTTLSLTCYLATAVSSLLV